MFAILVSLFVLVVFAAVVVTAAFALNARLQMPSPSQARSHNADNGAAVLNAGKGGAS